MVKNLGKSAGSAFVYERRFSLASAGKKTGRGRTACKKQRRALIFMVEFMVEPPQKAPLRREKKHFAE